MLPPHSRARSGEAADDRDQALTEFGRQVRDALTNLYDVVRLQTHPLATVARPDGGASPSSMGIALRQALLDAIEAVRPAPGVAASARTYRRYRLLEMRYIEGMDAVEIQEQMAIGKSEYYREHGEALSAVVSLLRERWGVSDRAAAGGEAPPGSDPSSPGPSRDELAGREAEELLAHVHVEPLDLAEALNEVVGLLRPLGSQKGVALSIELPVGLGLVQADRVVLRQALLGVLRPTMDHVAPGSLAIAASPAAGHVEVVVTAQAGDAGARPRSGPDLALGRRLVEALRGDLQVERGEERNVVRVSLPARRPPRVLVVDNSADFVALVSRYLSREDWEVVGASHAEQAYQLAQEARPSAILLDVMMPEHDGWDLLVRLRSADRTRDVPVIICSILNEPQFATSLGADGYLAKPVSQAELLRALAPWRSGRRGAVSGSPG